MITCQEAFERGFAVMVYSINQEEELNFAYKDKMFTRKRTPDLMGQLVKKDGMAFLPVYEDVGWDRMKQ